MNSDWALAVGINDYPDAGVTPLRGAESDALAFYEWVVHRQGGDVPESQAILMPDPKKPAGTKGIRLNDIIRFFEDLPGTLPAGRRLYIYLSGHGIAPLRQTSVRSAALLTANARPSSWINFPGGLWAEGIRGAAKFREVVLIMDCCRDLNDQAMVLSHIFGDPIDDGKSGRLVEAYATNWGSKARELCIPENGPKRGVFTYSLLHVLRSGKMTGALLKESVQKHLAELLKNEHRPQAADIGRDDDLDHVSFNENADPPQTPVAISGLQGKSLVIQLIPEGGDLTPINTGNWNLDQDCWRGRLEPGQYAVRRPGGGQRQFRVYAGIPVEVQA